LPTDKNNDDYIPFLAEVITIMANAEPQNAEYLEKLVGTEH